MSAGLSRSRIPAHGALQLGGWVAVAMVGLLLLGGWGHPPGSSGSGSFTVTPSNLRPALGASPVRAPSPTLTAGGPGIAATLACAAGDPAVLCGRAPLPPAPAKVLAGNSSPAGEIGTVSATITTRGEAYGAAFDPANGYVYVANNGFGGTNVSVLNGTKFVASVTAGTRPSGAIYDPDNREVYVTNTGSNNVTVINGTTVVAWIHDASFNNPYGGAYSPATGDIYVPNVNGNTVTVINGVKVVAVVTVGQYPFAVAYNPANHDLYVTNDATVANGGSTVSVINKTTVVATISGSFTNPSGIAYDPLNGYLYVGNKNLTSPTHSFVTVIYNQTKVLTTFKAGHDIFGVTFDAGNGLIYTQSSDNDLGGFNRDNLTAINGTVPVGNVTVGAGSYFVVYDSLNGELYATNGYSGTVSVVSTTLAEGPVTATPAGNPRYSSDAGQSVTLRSTLWALGATPDVAWVNASPSLGSGCGAPSLTPGSIGENISVACTPTVPGNYTIWLNATDAVPKLVWSWVAWQVYPDPNASAPVATVSGGLTVTSADVGHFVTLSVGIGPGSGLAAPVTWFGLPTGVCATGTPPASNTSLVCRFVDTATLAILVHLSDTNGMSATSPTFHLAVNPDLVIAAPTSSRPLIDVNESVSFSASVTGGAQPYTAYVWSGLGSGSCSGLGSATPTCTFASAAILTVAVGVTDASGVSSGTSPLLSFQVDPALRASSPTTNHSGADVGQSILFSVAADGGSGDYSYAWSGLPATCPGGRTAAVPCVMTTVGTVSARVTVTDTNGATVAPAGVATVTIVPATVVGTIAITPVSVPVGQPVTIVVAVAGGAGGYRYSWIGLPSGCAGHDASQLVCNPSQSGVFSIAVNVVDANGFVALANVSRLTVTPAPSSGPTIGGLSPLEFYGIIGVVAAVAVVAALVLVRRR